MKWLITGGCGFIGRSLTRSLVRQGGHSGRVLDNLRVGSRGHPAAAASEADIPVRVAGWDAPVTLTVGDVVWNFSDTSKARARLWWEAETLSPLGLRQTLQSFIQPHQYGQGVS